MQGKEGREGREKCWRGPTLARCCMPFRLLWTKCRLGLGAVAVGWAPLVLPCSPSFSRVLPVSCRADRSLTLSSLSLSLSPSLHKAIFCDPLATAAAADPLALEVCACLSACIYVCIYAYMYVCMYACIC